MDNITEQTLTRLYGADWRIILARRNVESLVAALDDAVNQARQNADMWERAGVDRQFLDTMTFFISSQIDYIRTQLQDTARCIEGAR